MRQVLALKQRAEDRFDAPPVGVDVDVFAERDVRLRDDEVVGVGAGGVRHDGDVIGRSHGADAERLGEAADPHHVGLEDVDGAALDQGAGNRSGCIRARRWSSASSGSAP